MAVDAPQSPHGPASDPQSRTRSQVAWSCLVDDTPQIWSSITPWLATAIEVAGIEPSRLYVHHVCPLRPEVADLCATLGVNVVSVPAFDGRSPHCNKIRQCQTNYAGADRVLLTDVDIVFAREVAVEAIAAPVAGKLVDAPNPPIAILERVFAKAGLDLPSRHTCSFWNAQSRCVEFETVGGNFNGGLYVIGAAILPALGHRWEQWARWLLDRIDLLDKWRVHVDQVSFCLALAEVGLEFQLLPNAWNFPTHLEVETGLEQPLLLHHHGRLDPDMRLQQVDEPQSRPAIARVNAAIEQFQRRYFDNRSFWNHRYSHHAAPGSDQGSRGEALEQKRGLLAAVIPPDVSVLDWGCGDLETTRHLECGGYVGVDVSVEALRIAAAKRPDWTFGTPPVFELTDGGPRDVVLCLDVLVHQPEAADYRALVRRLLGLSRRGALIAGYGQPPALGSHITFFHEPLATTMASIAGVAAIMPLFEYGDTTLYFVAKGERPMARGIEEGALDFARRVLAARQPEAVEGSH